MTRAFISIGSNISPENNVRDALLRLASRVAVHAISTVYLTDPSAARTAVVFNCVLSIESSLPPRDLKYSVLRRSRANWEECGAAISSLSALSILT